MEVIEFIKEFIISKNFKKLKFVNAVNVFGDVYLSTVEKTGNLPDLKTFIEYISGSRHNKFTIDALVTIKDKLGEHLINQRYTLICSEVVKYYDQYIINKRDKKIEDIID